MKNPTIADGGMCVRLCREIDSNNHKRPQLFPLRVLYNFQLISIRLPNSLPSNN